MLRNSCKFDNPDKEVNFAAPMPMVTYGYNSYMPLDSRQMYFDSSASLDLIAGEPHEVIQLRDGLEQAYRYYWGSGQSHFFYREGLGSVHVRSFIEERNQKLLIVSPGRAESSLKYAELCYELKGSGFDIIVMDHRGQGFSERYFGVEGHGHVERFQDYSYDLLAVIEHFQERKKYRKTIGLAHSMGAAIALNTQLLDKNTFSGLILSSPMLKILSRKIPEPLAAMTLDLLGRSPLNTKPLYKRKESKDQRALFESNLNTGCPHRFSFHRDLEKRHPQLLIGAPTYGWLREAARLSRSVMKNKKALDIGILLMQAEEDEIVCNRAQDKFAHEVNNCRLIRLKEARHEVLHERDSIRNRALVQIHKFLKEYS